MAAANIFTPYEATSVSLEDAEPLYAVNFEFQGQDASLLRLEAEFAESPASGLFEVSQKRWIKPQGEDKIGDKRPPLQVAVIDFEGYALRIRPSHVYFRLIFGLVDPIGNWKLKP